MPPRNSRAGGGSNSYYYHSNNVYTTLARSNACSPPYNLSVNPKESYRDLLIFEERLKQNSARLASQRKKYEGECREGSPCQVTSERRIRGCNRALTLSLVATHSRPSTNSLPTLTRPIHPHPHLLGLSRTLRVQARSVLQQWPPSHRYSHSRPLLCDRSLLGKDRIRLQVSGAGGRSSGTYQVDLLSVYMRSLVRAILARTMSASTACRIFLLIGSQSTFDRTYLPTIAITP